MWLSMLRPHSPCCPPPPFSEWYKAGDLPPPHIGGGLVGVAGDPVEQVGTLKSQPGKDIVLTGSISLAHTLIAAGAVDEYRLFVYPTVQGRGRRLFPDGTAIPKLSPAAPPKSFRSGITLLRYAA